jgi:hypothetical protein
MHFVHRGNGIPDTRHNLRDGRGCPKRRSHASDPNPMTQESPPSRSRNSTARTSAARSPHNERRAARFSGPGLSVATRKIAARVSGAATACARAAIYRLLPLCSSDRASSGVDSASVRLPRNCRRISPSASQTDSASRTRVYQRSRPRCDQDFSVVRRRTQCQRDRKRPSFRS